MAGLLRGVARTAAVAGTATAVSNRVSRRQSQKWAGQDQQVYTQEPEVSDTTAQLQELASLKQQGILTQEEFEAKKKQILGI